MGFWSELLIKLDGSVADLIIGAAIVAIFLLQLKAHARIDKQFDKLESRMDERFSSVNDRQKESSDKLWSKLDELRNKYHQLDKLTYGVGIAIQKAAGVKLFKQSADANGDNALNRDV